MSDQLTLPAEMRERAGKGASRALRNEGRVPAVIYGAKKDPIGIHVEEKELTKMLQTGHFMNSIVEVSVDGDKHRTLPKDVQFHPVTSRPIHVDFFRLSKGATVQVNIPIRITDEEASPGKKAGGVLNIVRHELELSVDATAIPDEVVVSLDGMEIGDSIHLSDVELPEGAKSVIDRDFTILTMVAPRVQKVEEEETDEEGEEVAADEVPATEQKDDAEGGDAE
ncbi:50S ribosomal protein L25/general stress protein Ctc [Sphingomicrobium sediminis]|uniref:Large ribosomal subunit protein bL25 n=1 Tax=Sphingomicrobium sediminis TaxID=2950949 RepID=A0A9X2EKM4_9SPHN|nr:50S ribosomal protein L25/general stress protein Ctc [Sphingomicrobium sediminis]MCM8557132.1 50S ribosomal protein L25/general stress protein Ctc [Sphingomicrobium sediminis]